MSVQNSDLTKPVLENIGFFPETSLNLEQIHKLIIVNIFINFQLTD